MFALPLILASTPLPFLSPAFGDHMVLQRDKPNVVWGWTKPGAAVSVALDHDAAQRVVAGADGKWQATISPGPCGSVHTLKVVGTQQVELHDLITGDVWLCGGQSNMELGLGRAEHGAQEIAAADNPQIRIMTVHQQPSYAAASTFSGTWRVCSPSSIAQDGVFSAVAYFFGREVQRQSGVPIGLIKDCWGGTAAETWAAPAVLLSQHLYGPEIAEMVRLHDAHAPEYGNYLYHWVEQYDLGLGGATALSGIPAWAKPEFSDHDWQSVPVPGAFAALGIHDTPGLVWLRRHVNLPDPLPAGEGMVHLGEVDKFESTYVNGQWVGGSSWVEHPRDYAVNRALLHPGDNVIAVRIYKPQSPTAFRGTGSDIAFTLGSLRVALAGNWLGKVSVDARPPHPLPLIEENYPDMPGTLYQGMIQPLAPLAITGALWYQGESNAGRADRYYTLLPDVIRSWRAAFHQGDFPFLIVQLPKFQHPHGPETDGWADLRAAQAHTAATLPNAGLAVTIDTGEMDNVHPTRKQPVGDRLARIALAMHYGVDLPHQGPTVAVCTAHGSEVRLDFANLDGGLRVTDGAPAEFSVAGKDGQWHWASARQDGNGAIVLSSPAVSAPVEVRYAWQSFPKANVFNAAGLPAAPFDVMVHD
ncbi:MAG TPA: sialate O-acetylesterase [Opitutaceae bacterium]|jgi:sialate O-acetylesterase